MSTLFTDSKKFIDPEQKKQIIAAVTKCFEETQALPGFDLSKELPNQEFNNTLSP